MTDIASTNPSPIYQEDKKKLNRLCLRSFRDAFKDVKPSIHFIFDHCPKDYEELVKIIDWDYDFEFTEYGINGTMLLSYERALKEDEYVLFQECDYLYRPNIGKLYIDAMDKLGIVSPYDHLNFYQDRNIHSATCDIELISGHHFRSTERNTMSWGCHSLLIKNNIDILKEYGYLDDLVWRDLMYAGHRLWVPIPSFATHMVKDYLAPGVNWESIWKKYL